MQTRDAIRNMKQAVSHVDIDAVTEQARNGWDKFRHLSENINDDEKRYSILGGSALGALGLTRIGRPSGWLMLGIGAALIIRGVTGHCGVYDAMGVDTKNR